MVTTMGLDTIFRPPCTYRRVGENSRWRILPHSDRPDDHPTLKRQPSARSLPNQSLALHIVVDGVVRYSVNSKREFRMWH